MYLRDYLYLDTDRLEDYMSVLDPGEIQQLKGTMREATAEGGESLPALNRSSASADLQREEVWERTISVSEKNSFNRLYEKLAEENALADVDSGDYVPKRSDGIEVSRAFEPSPIVQATESLMEMAGLVQSMGVDDLSDPESQQVLAFINLLSNRGGDQNSGIPMTGRAEEGGYSILFTAKRQFILRDVEEFIDEVTLIGKVRKIIPASTEVELLEIVDTLPRSLRRNRSFKQMITQMFTSEWPEELGSPLEPSAFKVKGPALIVDALAVVS